jgi:geranylgeranyl diphosphate synthase type II
MQPGDPVSSAGSRESGGSAFEAYLEDSRLRVLDEIRAILPDARRPGGRLYELMLDYPLRGGKALRPALAIATCRALGGHLEAVLRTAAVLELYHNAFLIHDDVEDGSELRRSERTLHLVHGVPIAVNVGDGMLAASMAPLLENIELVGLGRALRILQIVARMARESAEGQMIELDWVRAADWSPTDRGYLRMIYKKTAWYTFLAPVCAGAVAAGGDAQVERAFVRFATPLGVAFQIQDDALNLTAGPERYGKELLGDLWEGKHTLILIEAVRSASPSERTRAREVLAKPRCAKTLEDVAYLHDLIRRSRGVEYALGVARRHAARAAHSFARLARGLAPSPHRDFLSGLVAYVVERDR